MSPEQDNLRPLIVIGLYTNNNHLSYILCMIIMNITVNHIVSTFSWHMKIPQMNEIRYPLERSVGKEYEIIHL